MTGLAQVMEAAGRTLAASPLMSTALLGASLLSLGGSEDQKAEYLPPLLAGEHIFALALEEGTRHAPDRIALKAERDGAGYRLNGQKTFVLDGHVADTLIVAARTGGRASRCSWCPASAASAHPPDHGRQPQRRPASASTTSRSGPTPCSAASTAAPTCSTWCSTAPAPASPPRCWAARRRRSTAPSSI